MRASCAMNHALVRGSEADKRPHPHCSMPRQQPHTSHPLVSHQPPATPSPTLTHPCTTGKGGGQSGCGRWTVKRGRECRETLWEKWECKKTPKQNDRINMWVIHTVVIMETHTTITESKFLHLPQNKIPMQLLPKIVTSFLEHRAFTPLKRFKCGQLFYFIFLHCSKYATCKTEYD